MLDLLWSVVEMLGEFVSALREPRGSPFRVAYPLIGFTMFLLGVIGLLALAPACWMVAGFLALPGLPIVAVLDHRYRLRHGLYTPDQLKKVRESIRTWVVFALVIVTALAVVLLLARG